MFDSPLAAVPYGHTEESQDESPQAPVIEDSDDELPQRPVYTARETEDKSARCRM